MEITPRAADGVGVIAVPVVVHCDDAAFEGSPDDLFKIVR